MKNNFIYAKTKTLFQDQLLQGNILHNAVVFIEDTKEIWTHGTYFPSYENKWSVIESTSSTFTVIRYIDSSMQEFEFEEGMTWADFCNSEYNTEGWYISDSKIVTYANSFGSISQIYFLSEDEYGSYPLNADSLITVDTTYNEAYTESGGVGGGGGFA